MKQLFIIIPLFLRSYLAVSQNSEWECGKANVKMDMKTFARYLCNHIDSQKLSECTYNHTYSFECSLEIVAGVERPKDSDSVIRKKVQDWWNEHKYQCTCSRTNFLVSNGSIIKFAFQSYFRSFFYTVFEEFDLDVNFVDPSDGKTLLDFAKEEYERSIMSAPNNPGTLERKKLFDYIRSNGALYKSELK